MINFECVATRDKLVVELGSDAPGNFVSNYHWQDGIGPISERPKVHFNTSISL